MRVLALDIASSCGWCIGGPGATPRFGTFKVPPALTPDDLGRRGAAFSNWLSDFVTVDRPNLIAFEAPISSAGLTNMQTIRMLYGLAFVAEMIAHIRGIDCEEANLQSVRKYFCGRGNAKKPDVISECVNGRGWNIADDHQADAGAVWAYVMAGRGFDRRPLERAAGMVA